MGMVSALLPAIPPPGCLVSGAVLSLSPYALQFRSRCSEPAKECPDLPKGFRQEHVDRGDQSPVGGIQTLFYSALVEECGGVRPILFPSIAGTIGVE